MFLDTFFHMDPAVWLAIGLLGLSLVVSLFRLCRALVRGKSL